MTLSEWIKELQAIAEEKGGDIEVRMDETDGKPHACIGKAFDIKTKKEWEVLYIG